MKKILVATDFSSRSDRAIRRSTVLAKRIEASISLIHVVDDDQPARMVEAEQAASTVLLDETTRSLREIDGVSCDSSTILGDPFDGITKAAGEIAPDLLVIGPHRRQALKDVFVGTTAERTIRASRLPVLMANGVPAGFYRHVLIAVDLSVCSGDAVRAAIGLGLHNHAPVCVVHVFEAPGTGLITRAMMKDRVKDYLAEEERLAAEELATFLSNLEFSPSHQILRLNGTSIADTICSVAQEISADLIVVGTHGRTGVSKLLLGSDAEEVLRISDRDVMAVPPRHSG